jgi:SAM-dependent methyltransferase
MILLKRLGQEPSSDASILDFGCGAGASVYAFLNHGFANVFGFDARDYLNLKAPEDRRYFRTGWHDGKLPFENDSFDFIFSEEVFEHVHDQVPSWRELYRIMKPGSYAIHSFPGSCALIEPHNYVPFGGVISHYWWYKLWALLGIRNEAQRERKLDATETARWNTFRYVENLKYVNSSCYKVVWEQCGFEWRWLTQESFDLHHSAVIRLAGRINRILPMLGWAFRALHTRKVLLHKPLK